MTLHERSEAHDRFWAEANIELGRLSRVPGKVLDELAQVDPDLHTEMKKLEFWLHLKSIAYRLEGGHKLEDLRAGWRKWLRMFRHALEKVPTAEGGR